MSDDFDPSPRATKRRRTSRYGAQNNTLSVDEAVDQHSNQKNGANGSEHYTSAEENQISTPSRNQRSSKKASAKSSKTRSNTQAAPQDTIEETVVDPTTPSKSARGSKAAGVTLKHRPSLQEAELRIDAVQKNGQHGDPGDAGHTNGVEPLAVDEAEQLEKVDDNDAKTRSSSRQRKKPSRYIDTEPTSQSASIKHLKTAIVKDVPMRDAPESPALKGILTPSRRQKTGPRKSVMFNQDDEAIGEQLGFKDIGTQAKTTPKKFTKQKEQQADQPGVEQPTSTITSNVNSIPEDEYLDAMLVDEATEIEPPLLDLPNEPLDQLSSRKLSANPHLTSIKQTVLSRLTSTSSPPTKPPPHLDSQYQTLDALLTATVTASESNSLLLLGPRGCGKTALLRTSLHNLTQNHGSDFFHTVHLSGILQTDDRLALREIWRQLGREMNVDETETEDVAGSYADTMASLLSLLSHLDEMALDSAQDETIDPQMLATDASGVTNGAQKTAKSIIFILDEFDLFTTHPRQTLLYNLFDIAQSRKAPIAVIGCSTRMDVIECLEKRVKSRFSHRWLLVPGCRNLIEWETCAKDVLTLSTEGKDVLQRSNEEEKWVERWNGYITDTFLKSDSVQRLLKTHFYTTKSLPNLFMSLYPHIAELDMPLSDSTTQASTTTRPNLPQIKQLLVSPTASPSILSVLTTLPTLHLSLLISATRLTTIHSLPAVNFNLVHTHYTELITRSKLQQTAHGAVAVGGSLREWSRETCRETWEELGLWGVMVPVVGLEDGAGGAEGEETRMWRVELGLEEVEWGVKERFGGDGRGMGAGEVLLKWCREV